MPPEKTYEFLHKVIRAVRMYLQVRVRIDKIGILELSVDPRLPKGEMPDIPFQEIDRIMAGNIPFEKRRICRAIVYDIDVMIAA